MDLTKATGKRKRLKDINVLKVALVDVPAVPKASFLIAKSEPEPDFQEEESMSDTNATGGTTVTDQGQTAIVQAQPPAPAPATSTVSDTSGSAPREVVFKALTTEQQRAIFFAVNTIESANFFGPDGEEPEPMPKEVMQAVKNLRQMLGDKVAKRLDRQHKAAIAKSATDADEALTPHINALTLLDLAPLQKAGSITQMGARTVMSAVLTATRKGLGAVAACLEKDSAEELEAAVGKAREVLTACQEVLAKSDLATALTDAEREQLELEELQARQTEIISRQLRAKFEAMSEDEFREHLAQCDDAERQQILEFLTELDEPEGTDDDTDIDTSVTIDDSNAVTSQEA